MKKSETSGCDQARPYLLKNIIQHYNWGKHGENAFIAHLQGITAEDDQPFAELWMGVHPNAPSQIIDPKVGARSLSDWISANPAERLGLEQTVSFSGSLPYLFKVLSADKALSIQAHPSKAQAIFLHKQDPEHYPDDNHKPELAVAIDHLDALIGFISDEKYQSLLKSTPEINTLTSIEGNPADLQTAILTLLKTASTKISSCIASIKKRLSTQDKLNETESLFLELTRLNDPSDIGLIFIFLLNRVHLEPGEAVFLPSGIPHAYLRGNIIECMANSDNVVRLGLTEKFCDKQTLSDILEFNSGSDFRVPSRTDGSLKEYISPVEEFRVKSLELPEGDSRRFSYRSGLTMFLVLEGEISLLWGGDQSSCTCVYQKGDSFIAPANLKKFRIQARSNSKIYLVDIPPPNPGN